MGKVLVLAVMEDAARSYEDQSCHRCAELMREAVAAVSELIVFAECSAALEMRADIGHPILERHGWDWEDRFDIPAAEFVRRLGRAALAKVQP